MLVKPWTSSLSSTVQPWQPHFKIDALFILLLVSSFVWNMKLSILVSDPMKEEKSHENKSIQSLGLNTEVALVFMGKHFGLAEVTEGLTTI